MKCIYIDPPYNTGKDSFNYNDRFNHSTWLTFMRNRLELAKRLLRDDGVIFVSLSDQEAHYCKVLMDEIFDGKNYLNDVIWNSTKSVTNKALISVSHTHTLIYFKNKDYYVTNRTEFRLLEDGSGFSNPDNDPRGPWKADPFQVGGWRPNQQYEIVNPNTGVSYFPNEGSSWKNEFTKYQELVADNRIIFGVAGEAGPQRKRFLYEALERGKVAKTIWDDVGTTTNGTEHLKQLFGKAVFKNPKPEQLIKRILELATEPKDLVLDFFLGSGTTAAVAHKMGRRYIGIEQMDYIEEITVARLQKVLDGEQGGISQEVGWTGGGSFVYCELLENSAQLIKEIQEANVNTIYKVRDKIYSDHRIVPFLTSSELKEADKEFQDLRKEGEEGLLKQKELLIRIVDKNKLYVNFSDAKDEDYKVDEADLAFSTSFYSKREGDGK